MPGGRGAQTGLWHSPGSALECCADPGTSGVAGDPFDISVGGTDIRRFISHLTVTQLSWMRGKPTTCGETVSSMELR